jgi:hypothetical protein
MIALDKDTMSEKEVIDFVSDLIRSNVASLFSTRELDRYVELGIFNKKHDRFEMTELAERILPHKCSKRCMIRISDGRGPECFQCKKPHPTAGRRDPLEDEFRETQFSLSPELGCAFRRNSAGFQRKWDKSHRPAWNGPGTSSGMCYDTILDIPVHSGWYLSARFLHVEKASTYSK